MATEAKKRQLQTKFAELDTNGDNSLDFDELKVLLNKGGKFSDAEVHTLYNNCDSNHDGRVDFNEFLAYIYGAGAGGGGGNERTSGGRHDRMAAASGPANDGSEISWDGCKHTFEAYAGQDMDGREWNKFVKDNGLLGHGLAKTDVDLIFSKVVPKGKRRMDFAMFQDACRLVASKKGVQNVEIQNKVAGSAGPVLAGTKTDAVRFYDDKSTYTGAATFNEKFEGADPNAAHGRHEKQQAEAAAAAAGGGAEGDWGPVQEVFVAFTGKDGQIDGREFLKMCDDSGLIGRGFAKNDVDVTFASVARKAKKIGFEEFKGCVRGIATRKGQGVADIQAAIVRSGGPVLHATKAEAVRFHDDKSTYTGAHAGVHGKEGGLEMGDARHARLSAETEAAEGADEGEHDWAEVLGTYRAFGGADGADGREMMKLCTECGLFDKNFAKTDCDVIFAKVAQKARRLDDEKFTSFMRLVAKKKGVPTFQVQTAVQGHKPEMHGTTAEYSRFHDDKSTYTGAHVGK